MQSDLVREILEKIPANDLSRTVMQLRFGQAITLDAIIRQEEDYIIVRGREAGTDDNGRAFFVPYEEIFYFKLDRVVKLGEIRRLYGEKVEDEEDLLAVKADTSPTTNTQQVIDPKATPAPAQALDPANIAKQNLLARIRAARTAAGASQS